MNYAKMILAVLGALYTIMRPILLKAINDPEAESGRQAYESN